MSTSTKKKKKKIKRDK